MQWLTKDDTVGREDRRVAAPRKAIRNGSVMVPVILSRLVPRPVLVRVRALSAVGVFVTVGVFVLVPVAVLCSVRVRVLVRVLVRVRVFVHRGLLLH